MKIKEIEKRTGISSPNIRFYEAEGLICPMRNQENNYREYSEEDVSRLEQIKTLRLLGVPIGDIKAIYKNEQILEEVIAKRIGQLEKEETHAREMRRACENILMQHLELDMLDGQVLVGEKEIWTERLRQILKEDMTKVGIGRKELNRYMGLMLLWGYGINFLISLVIRDHFTVYMKFADTHAVQLVMILLVVMLVCKVAVVWTASVKVHLIVFYISAFAETPTMMFVFTFAGEKLREQLAVFLPVFWIGAILYVLALWLITGKWERCFESDRNAVGIALGAAVVLTGICYLIYKEWRLQAGMFLIADIYIGLFWFVANKDVKEYNRYYAVMSANRILNPVAVVISYWGRGQAGFWR